MVKHTQRRKIALIFLVLILVAPFLNIAVRKIWGGIGNSVWDGQHHINIVVDSGDDISVWSIEPVEKQVYEIVIPTNTYLTVPSYGSYRAGAIGTLSMLEKKDGSLLAAAIEESLGVPVDGVIVQKGEVKETIDLRSFLGAGGIMRLVQKEANQSQWQTNFSFFDTIRLWMFSTGVTKDGIEVINMADLDAISKISLPDGSEGLTVDKDRFSTYAVSYFTDRTLRTEGLTVEIFNGTSLEGRANSLAILLTNSGTRVINTAKTDSQNKTTILSAKKSYTADRIARITKGRIIHEMPKEGRADILVLLGGD